MSLSIEESCSAGIAKSLEVDIGGIVRYTGGRGKLRTFFILLSKDGENGFGAENNPSAQLRSERRNFGVGAKRYGPRTKINSRMHFATQTQGNGGKP